MGAYAKTLAALLAAVLAAVMPGLLDAPMGWPEWINVVVLAAGALHVANAENVPGWRYAKAIAAGVAAAGVAVIAGLSDGVFTTAEVVQVVLAVLGVAGVGAVRNAGTVKGVFVGRHRGLAA